MKTRNEKLNQAAAVVAKVAEMLYWACGFVVFAFLLGYVFHAKAVLELLVKAESGGVYFFTMLTNWDKVPEAFGPEHYLCFAVFLVMGVASCVLGAKVFRNVYLLFRTTAGKTSFSLGPTPFQPANVKLLREMGLLAFAVPVIEGLGYVVMACMVGPGVFAEAAFSVEFLVLGIVVLCLTQFFAYGVELQTDVEGLL